MIFWENHPLRGKNINYCRTNPMRAIESVRFMGITLVVKWVANARLPDDCGVVFRPFFQQIDQQCGVLQVTGSRNV
jgi:hypothetical protein